MKLYSYTHIGIILSDGLSICLYWFVSGPWICFCIYISLPYLARVCTPWDDVSHTLMIPIRLRLITSRYCKGSWVLSRTNPILLAFIVHIFHLGPIYVPDIIIILDLSLWEDVSRILWSWYDIDLWPQVKNYSVFMLDPNFCWLCRQIIYALGSITMIRRFASFYSWYRYNVDLWH